MKLKHYIPLLFCFLILSAQTSFSQKIWYKKSNFKGGARSGSVSFVIDQTAYVGLGDSASICKSDIYKYNATADTWTKIADFPGEVRSMAVAFTLNGKAYVGLGHRYLPTSKVYTDFYQYDPALDTWTIVTDYSGGARYGAVAFTLGDTAYVGSGRDASVYLKDFYKFYNGTWTKIADLVDGPRGFAVGFSYNSKGYIAGGLCIEGYSSIIRNNVYAYNTTLNKWEETIYGHANLGVQFASAYVLSDTAWIMYGSMKKVLAFDPNTKTIQNFNDKLGLGYERSSNISFVINGNPYFGLGDYYLSPKTNYTKDIWTFGEYNFTPTALNISDSVVTDKCQTGTLVGILSTTDKNTNETFTYSLVAGNGTNDADNSLFSISGNNLKTADTIDFSVKQQYKIFVKTTDKGGASFSRAITISKLYFEYNANSGLPASGNNSCQWLDYNSDGYLDVIYAYPFKLFRNNRNGTFTDVSANLNGTTDGKEAACHDFNKDGNIDFLVLSSNQTKLFINNGDSTFTIYNNTGLASGYLRCADYNNDGFTDVLVNNRLFKNNGNYTFTEQTDLALPPGDLSAAKWADYNNDGWQDFVVMGRIIGTPTTQYCRLYKNNGDGTFSVQSQDFSNPYWGSVDWGDYNNDGQLDLLLAGGYSLKVYKNNGDGSFTNANAILTGFEIGNASWGDFNNDGYLDILATGFNWTLNNITRIYTNNKNGGFDKLPANISSADYNIWGDYNNDGKLDFLITGKETLNGKAITRLYTNIGATTSNTKPISPLNLTSTINNETVTLSWDKATDAETSQNGLSYNIRIGISSKGNEVVPSLSDSTTGKLKTVNIGNCGPKTSFTMKLPKGKFNWSVQTIDAGFAASTWATEQNFTISNSTVKLKQSITIKNRTNYIYGDDPKLIAWSTSGLPSTFSIVKNDTASIKNDTLMIKSAGKITVIATQAGNESYEPSSVSQSITIDKRMLKYFGRDTTSIYGNTLPAIKISYVGFVKNDNESVINSKPTLKHKALYNSVIGAYPYLNQYSGSDNNYKLEFQEKGNMMITKRPLNISVDNVEKLENTDNPVITLKYDGLASWHKVDSIQVLPTIVHSVAKETPAGVYEIKLEGGSDTRYNFILKNGTFTVNLKTGFIDETKESIRIYPIPLSNITYIELPFVKLSTIKVFDAKGSCIDEITSNESKIELNTSNYLKGVYIIQVKTGNEIIETKVIK